MVLVVAMDILLGFCSFERFAALKYSCMYMCVCSIYIFAFVSHLDLKINYLNEKH